jgi:voltage-gated potassium channel Kch
MFGSVYLINRYVLPSIFNKIARSHELLFLSSLAWCFILAVASLSLGFSAEIGAFLAGITVATLPYSNHIAAKTKPLRDFFIMIFFIYMGSNLIFEDALQLLPQAAIFALVILIVNPIVVSIAISLMGFRKRTSFISGITLTQISEFSFIVVILGTKLNILPKETITLTSLVAMISIFISTYIISNASKIYSMLRGKLFFLKANSNGHDLENLPLEDIRGHVILIGHHRIGSIILEDLKENKEQVIVIDFDPNRIRPLLENKEYCIYGDAADHDIIESLHVKSAKTIISTIDKYEESLTIIEEYKRINKKLEIIVTANDSDEALDLYKAGASLVIVPTLISGDYLAYLLKRIRGGNITMEQARKKEIKSIEEHDN